MSAALPDHPRADREAEPAGRRLASVPDGAGTRRDGEVEALRDQIVLLARHYAGDVSRLHRTLDRTQTDEARARAERLQAERRADGLRRERDDLRAELARAREEAARMAERLDAAREAAALPWWAVSRRRAIRRQADRTR